MLALIHNGMLRIPARHQRRPRGNRAPNPEMYLFRVCILCNGAASLLSVTPVGVDILSEKDLNNERSLAVVTGGA